MHVTADISATLRKYFAVKMVSMAVNLPTTSNATAFRRISCVSARAGRIPPLRIVAARFGGKGVNPPSPIAMPDFIGLERPSRRETFELRASDSDEAATSAPSKEEEEDLPPWVKNEMQREVEGGGNFGLYLLGSAIVCIAAVRDLA